MHLRNTSAVALVLGMSMLAGCQVSRTALSENQQEDLRVTAREFTSALRAGDSAQVRSLMVVDSDPENRSLSYEVLRDTLAGRKLVAKLAERFHYVEEKPTVIGSNTWINRLQTVADVGSIQRDGDRVRLGDRGQDGRIYLRKVGGTWKVDLIPTLVYEAGGDTYVEDTTVPYRFGVTRAINEWMLTRLERGDFKSKQEFDDARSSFWIDYLNYAANGKDPKQTLLTTLPPMPRDDGKVVTER